MLGRLLTATPALAETSVRPGNPVRRPGPAERFPGHGCSVFALTAWEPEAALAALPTALPAAPLPRPLPQVAEMRLRLELPERFFSRAAERLAQYLTAEHAPATVRRGEDLPPAGRARALKRKVLLAGAVRAAGDTTIAELTVGPRFRLRRYLAIFPEPEAWRRTLVEVDFTAGAP
jgi:hypothetical protein